MYLNGTLVFINHLVECTLIKLVRLKTISGRGNFSPFSAKAPKSSSASASSGEFEISFPASSLQGLSQGGTVTLSGSIDSVSFN